MLDPRDRQLLLEALRPPAGYRLERAVATTYTLDLLALLTAPLAFTFFDWEDREGRPCADPLALLEAIRRNANKLHVFCEGGAIHVPRSGRPLLAHLEPCIVEVAAPRGGVFHPKVWALHYEPTEPDSGDEACYRLLVGTRNLTFDRSWDTLLRLDGEPGGAAADRERNRPLVRFLEALPGLATHGASTAATESVRELAAAFADVRWDLPAKATELEFLPFGIGDAAWPFSERGRRLVVAPFVEDHFLSRFEADSGPSTLVSRPDSLQGLSHVTDFGRAFVLSDGVEEEAGYEGDDDVDEDEALHGLHAKLFVFDDGWYSDVFTGSANATRAAFESNVEFLVRLRGKKSVYGIDAVLDPDERGGLHDLLQEWKPVEVEEDEHEELRRELERAADDARRRIARAELHLVTDARSDDEFVLELHGEVPPLDDRVRVTCWPAVQRDAAAAELGQEQPLARFVTSFGATTAFMAFSIVAAAGGEAHRSRFVRRLPITGLPEDREERLLRGMLKDRETVLRLLYLLLSAQDVSATQLTSFATGSGEMDADWSVGAGLPLFEALVRALARGPEALSPVERLVNDLSRTEEGRALLPEGFDALWGAVSGARAELAR